MGQKCNIEIIPVQWEGRDTSPEVKMFGISSKDQVNINGRRLERVCKIILSNEHIEVQTLERLQDNSIAKRGYVGTPMQLKNEFLISLDVQEYQKPGDQFYKKKNEFLQQFKE